MCEFREDLKVYLAWFLLTALTALIVFAKVNIIVVFAKVNIIVVFAKVNIIIVFCHGVCDPSEGRQPTALAEGGRGREMMWRVKQTFGEHTGRVFAIGWNSRLCVFL